MPDDHFAVIVNPREMDARSIYAAFVQVVEGEAADFEEKPSGLAD